MSKQYRVTHVPHFIESRMVYPDRGDESIVTMPKGVEPGRWLVEVGASAKSKEGDAADRDALLEQAKALGLKPHHNTGAEKLQEMIAEAKSKDGDGDEEPPTGDDLPDA